MKQAEAPQLEPEDLLLALRFVHQHCAPDAIERFISKALEGLFRLFPCIVANYGEIDRVRRTGSLRSYPAAYGTPRTNENALSAGFEDLGSVFHKHMGKAVRLSAILSGAEFRRTGMFREHFKPMGGRDLLVIQYDRNDGLTDFFSLFRQGYFSKRDQALLDAVAWPLQSALTNARALSYLYDHRSMLESGLRNSGWDTLIVNSEGRILVETSEAKRMLSFHFGARSPSDSLPEHLWRWVCAARETFEALSSTPLSEPAPFSVTTSGTLLVIRMLLHPSGCLLLLREADEKPEWKSLVQLGLSPREAQVLDLIAMGKTGPDIATLLGISHDTVRKHTSRIFVQLGVETRTAAALAATEARLGTVPTSSVSAGCRKPSKNSLLLQNRMRS